MKKKNPFSSHFNNNAFFEFLNNFVSENYEEWKKKYLNISGVHVGRKITKGKQTNRYAIIFHVIVKTDLIGLAEIIPSKILVVYKGEERQVPTDVLLTGESQLQYIAPGRNVMQFNNWAKRGGMGLIVFKDDQPHLLGNMHVLGWSYLPNSHVIIDKPIDNNAKPDINTMVDNVLSPVGFFRSGVIDKYVDAAIVFIPPNLYNLINERKEIFTIKDPLIFPPQPIKDPIPVRMLGSVSGFKDSGIVSVQASITFNYPFGPQTISSMVALSPCCSEPGDSGSPVYHPQTGRVVGIVVGRDQNLQFTFVIPYWAIQSAFNLQII